MHPASLNAAYTRRSMRRRYEVWFLRLLLAESGDAWWFRYLLMNLGAAGGGGCPGDPQGQPVQVWATRFPRNGLPQSFLQGFPQQQLDLSEANAAPFCLQIHHNRIGEDSCAGQLELNGHSIAWDLHYRSTLSYTTSDKGWMGFSRTPHSDAVFSGEIRFDGHSFRGDPLGYGMQGHNGGFRQRNQWNWTHAVFHDARGGGLSTFEALECEIPLGLRFRRALLWHRGQLTAFRKLKAIGRMRDPFQWIFQCAGAADGARLVADIDGRGISCHRLPYLTTNCRSRLDVAHNSRARAALYLTRPGQPPEQLRTENAALEMAGD